MPTYSAKCETCGDVCDYISRVDDREHTPECHGPMKRLLTSAMVSVPGGSDMPAYKCNMTGQTVTSMRQRKYLMEQQGVVDSRDLTTQWAKTRVDRAETKAELKRLDDAIPAEVKKAALATAPVLPS